MNHKVKLCTNDSRGVFSPVFIVGNWRYRVLAGWQFLGPIMLYSIEEVGTTSQRQTPARKPAQWVADNIWPDNKVKAYNTILANLLQ